MIVFLCGPDDYRRLAKRKFVVDEFLKKHPSGALAVFDGEEGSLAKLTDFLRQNSLFEEKKLGMVPEMEAYPELPKLWKEIAASKDTTLVVESRKIPPKSWPLAKVWVAREEFPALSGGEWRGFLAKCAKKLGANLSAGALDFISAVYRGDSWGAATELQKLSSLDKKISAEGLAAAGLSAPPEYWPMLNGLKSWNQKDRLRALAVLQSENEPAAKTFNILAASSYEKAPQFAELDTQVKSGKLEYEEALLELVIS